MAAMTLFRAEKNYTPDNFNTKVRKPRDNCHNWKWWKQGNQTL